MEVVTFQYGQRHSIELEKARWISNDLGVKQTLIDTSVIKAITTNALMDNNAEIQQQGSTPIPLWMGVMPYFCFIPPFMPKGRAFKLFLPACVRPILVVTLIAEMYL